MFLIEEIYTVLVLLSLLLLMMVVMLVFVVVVVAAVMVFVLNSSVLLVLVLLCYMLLLNSRSNLPSDVWVLSLPVGPTLPVRHFARQLQSGILEDTVKEACGGDYKLRSVSGPKIIF